MGCRSKTVAISPIPEALPGISRCLCRDSSRGTPERWTPEQPMEFWEAMESGRPAFETQLRPSCAKYPCIILLAFEPQFLYLQNGDNCVNLLVLPLLCMACVAVAEPLKHFKPQFPHLQEGTRNPHCLSHRTAAQLSKNQTKGTLVPECFSPQDNTD